MLEAVNSVLQNMPLLRASAEQSSTTDSFAVNPDRVLHVAQAPYITPYYAVDMVKAEVTLQIRDPQTGKVLQSYPSQTDLETAAHNPLQDAQAHATSVTAQPATQVQASADALVAARAAVAPTGQQIAAFGNAASAAQPTQASVSVLA